MRHHRDLSIAQRISLGLGALLVLLAALVAAVFHWQGESAEAQREFAERIEPRRDAAREVERAVLYLAVGVRRVLVNPDAERYGEYERRAAAARDALHAMAPLAGEPDGEEHFARASSLVGRYLADAEHLVSERRSGRPVEALEAALVESRELVLESIAAFVRVQDQKAHGALGAIERARQNVRRGLVGASLFAIVVFAAFGGLTIQSVRRPVNELLEAVEAVDRGDWTQAARLAPLEDAAAGARRPLRDELVRLARGFARAAGTLRRREQRLASEGEVAAATSATLEQDRMARAVLDAVIRQTGAEVGVFYRSAEGERLEPVAAHALDGRAAPLKVGEGLPGLAAARRELVVRDLPEEAGFQVELGYDRAPTRSLAAVPVTFGPTLHGVLVVGSLRALDEDALAFARRAAALLGVGLQNAASHAELRDKQQQIQAQNEELQAQNEEIQAQNEEIQAQNEEIQAQNEEIQAQSEEIHAQNEELRTAAENLQRHARALAEADRRKNEFLGLLAHELRNPMAPITNSLFILKKVAPGSEKAVRAQAVIERQAAHLTRLIDDLLDVTRVSRGKVQVRLERLDLADVVRQCVDDQREALERKGLAVDLDLPDGAVWVEGDRTRLCQVVGNLLHNAVKFTDRHGHVKVALGREPQRGRATVRVGDDGVGIEPELLQTLFEPFRQGATTLDRADGGLGLGLALVKGLVELHRGTVEARSDGRGKGAEFVVVLPLHSGSAAPAEAPPAAAPAGAPRRVLVIEDNVDSATSLREALELGRHLVELAFSGPEGLDKAHAFRPDVVLCDVGLPGMTGYEVAQAFRADPTLQPAFLVALTGYASPEDRDRALEAGFSEHLAKPPNLDHLLELLSRVGPAQVKAAEADRPGGAA